MPTTLHYLVLSLHHFTLSTWNKKNHLSDNSDLFTRHTFVEFVSCLLTQPQRLIDNVCISVSRTKLYDPQFRRKMNVNRFLFSDMDFYILFREHWFRENQSIYWWNWSVIRITSPPLSLSLSALFRGGFVHPLLHHIPCIHRFPRIFFPFFRAHPLIYGQRMAIWWNWWSDNDLSLFDYIIIYEWICDR